MTGEDEKRLTKSYTANPEAYQLYLQGRFWWNKRTEEGYNKGIEYFGQAIRKDPSYALAYAGLADCYSLLAFNGNVPAKQKFPRAKEAALKALEIDDALAEAHSSLAISKRSTSGTGKPPRENFCEPFNSIPVMRLPLISTE